MDDHEKAEEGNDDDGDHDDISTRLFVMQMIMKKLERTMLMVMITMTSPRGCSSCGK